MSVFAVVVTASASSMMRAPYTPSRSSGSTARTRARWSVLASMRPSSWRSRGGSMVRLATDSVTVDTVTMGNPTASTSTYDLTPNGTAEVPI
ncbi:hypothetical protein [Streptomyces sp. NPDC055105]|uniref:hypothetical protein n=1 Tax=Streptomyces sp. NPDC055105 TaxID=3365719 RepID=UPI0037D84E0F